MMAKPMRILELQYPVMQFLTSGIQTLRKIAGTHFDDFFIAL